MDLGQVQSDGATLRVHLQRLAKSTGRVDERLLTTVPRGGEALWDAWHQMAESRRSGIGAHALTLTDIQAWCWLSRVRLTPWETDTLIDMDAAALDALARNRAQQQATH